MQEPQHVLESHEVTSQGIEGLNIHFILAIIALLFVLLKRRLWCFLFGRFAGRVARSRWID